MKRLLPLLIILFLSLNLNAQTNTGSLVGIVKDSAGIPLDGVVIKLKSTYLGAVTDYTGKYKVDGITPGIYTVQVSAIEYKTVEYTNIKIEENVQKELNIILSATSYTVDQEIIVVGDRPLLDIEQTSSSHILSDCK